MNAMDSLNSKMGSRTLFYAGAGIHSKRTW
jgi:hypothetical protein